MAIRTVTIDRAGIFCADPNCGKELPFGSQAKVYHYTEGRKYFGMGGCHVAKKQSREEWALAKKKKMEFLIQKNNGELDKLLLQIQITTREEAIELVRKESSPEGLTDDEADLMIEIEKKIDGHSNKLLKKYAWPALRQEALKVPE